MRLAEVILPIDPRVWKKRSTRAHAARKALSHNKLQNFL
jgi:hypothetical protein